MSVAFTLKSRAAARDLSILLGRAARLDEAGAVRLLADGGALAVYVAVITPKGLLDRGPTVLGLRTFELAGGSFDEVVPIRALLAQLDAALDALPGSEAATAVSVTIPARTTAIGWAGITPPRGGWQPLSPLAPEPLADVARAGIEEVATAIPSGTGEQIVHRVRTEVWGRAVPHADHLPAGAAFALASLGFLSDDPVRQFRSGAWTRLSTARGHVLIKTSGWAPSH